MIRTALDSDDIHAFTDNTDFIFTYTDLIANPREFEAAHPLQIVRYIDRGLGDPGTKSTIADVERGAMKPGDLPAWYDEREALHLPFLTVYADRTNQAAVNQAMGQRSFNRWIATLDGTVHIAGFQPLRWPSLVQILGSTQLGINCDLSLVLSDGWNPSRNQSTLTNVISAITQSLTGSQRTVNELTNALNLAKTLH